MAKKDNFKELASRLPQLIGGRENITFFSHCITRLRFTLKDKGIVNIDDIGKIPGVMKAQWSGEQLQIVIGASVEDAYDMVSESMGFVKESIVEENMNNKDTKKKKRWGFTTILDGITGCIAPLIPIMVASGMLKVIILLLNMFGILSEKSSTYLVISFIADCGFYFLPVFVGAIGAKKFGANMGVGMVLGAVLIHPSFVEMVAAGGSITLLGLPIYATSYGNSIFPMIITMAVCAPVEKFIAKHVPASLRYVFEPTLTILIMAPAMLWVFAPLGAIFGSYLSMAIVWLYNTLGFIGTSVLAALFPLLIITGMHTATSPYIISSISTMKYEPLVLPAMFISNFNQAAASLAVGIKAKNKEIKSNALSCVITVFVGGVTEPAVFGVSVPLKTPLYTSMIGGLVGGAVLGLLKVYVYTLPASGGIFGFPAFIGGERGMMNMAFLMVSLVAGMITTFVLTLIFYKPGKEEV